MKEKNDMKKTIVILAKSIKKGHFCIAGKDLSTNKWIRVVSDENGGAITSEQSKLTFDKANAEPWDCRVLHNVEIEFSKPSSLYFQPENYVISGKHWIQRYSFDKANLRMLLDTPAPKLLWGDTSNKLEKTSIEEDGVSASLYLVEVNNLILYRNCDNKRKVDFWYNGELYENFSCTDPKFDSLESSYKQAILCLSLGELFSVDNCHYKIVASIFV